MAWREACRRLGYDETVVDAAQMFALGVLVVLLYSCLPGCCDRMQLDELRAAAQDQAGAICALADRVAELERRSDPARTRPNGSTACE